MAGYKLHHRESCGCKIKRAARERGKNNRSPQTVTYRIEYGKYKRVISNTLTIEQWKEVVIEPCVYCGLIDTRNATLNISYKPTIPLSEEEQILYQVNINEIAEINEKPVSCCNTCKCMRGKLSHTEFLKHIKLVVKKFKE